MSQSTAYQLDSPSGKDEEIQLTFFSFLQFFCTWLLRVTDEHRCLCVVGNGNVEIENCRYSIFLSLET